MAAITTDFLVGDFVQARKLGETAEGLADQYLVTEFVVTGVNGSRLYGSVLYPNGLGENDGWQFELISRTLEFPTTLSEIRAVRYDDIELTLMGKGEVWTNEANGERVQVADIKHYTVID